MNSSDSVRADEWLREANELSRQKDRSGARERLHAVLGLAGIDAAQRGWAMHALAHWHINGGEPAAADEWFDKIIDLDGAHPHCLCEAWVARGYRLAGRREWDAATVAFDVALSVRDGLACHRASAQFHLAKICVETGSNELACKAIEAFLQMPGGYPGEVREARRIVERLTP
jgi:hypothetical protein